MLSKLDLSKGFHQVLMSEESKDLTTFVCPIGKFCFRHMPFGLKNAPAVFQLLMEKALVSCKDFSAVYIDDIIIFSSCWDEHNVRKDGSHCEHSMSTWFRGTALGSVHKIELA